jgi:hypothetical protein
LATIGSPTTGPLIALARHENVPGPGGTCGPQSGCVSNTGLLVRLVWPEPSAFIT